MNREKNIEFEVECTRYSSVAVKAGRCVYVMYKHIHLYPYRYDKYIQRRLCYVHRLYVQQ